MKPKLKLLNEGEGEGGDGDVESHGVGVAGGGPCGVGVTLPERGGADLKGQGSIEDNGRCIVDNNILCTKESEMKAIPSHVLGVLVLVAC